LGSAGSRGDLPQQVANGIDAFYRLFVQLNPDLLADLQRQVHPSQRIDFQIELHTRLRRKLPVRIAVGKQLPDAHRSGIFEQHSVFP
jgi:hypothetical protein